MAIWKDWTNFYRTEHFLSPGGLPPGFLFVRIISGTCAEKGINEMNVLFFDWKDYAKDDAVEIFKELGHEVQVFTWEWQDVGSAPEIEAQLQKIGASFDCVFSFNYIPFLTKVCEKLEIPYACLVYDSPHLTLFSKEVNCKVNHIYAFDRKMVNDLQKEGVNTIRYSTLGVNVKRIERLLAPLKGRPPEHEISFLGQLYNGDAYNFYDQISYLPSHLKGRLDAVIAAQKQIFGMDLIGDKDVISDEIQKELHQFVKFDLTGRFKLDEDRILLDMLRRKVSGVERAEVLEQLAAYFSVDLYTRPGTKTPKGVRNLGYADYVSEMPKIFALSKINLNLTLRTIRSGIPLRALDIMGAGGFLLSNYQKELAEYFVEGEEVVLAYTRDDLLQKCAYYLEHEEERVEIARRGQAKVWQDFDYRKVLNRILMESVGGKAK